MACVIVYLSSAEWPSELSAKQDMGSSILEKRYDVEDDASRN